MEPSRTLELLHRHQDGLIDHLNLALAMLDHPADEVSLLLAQSRWEALRRLRAYQLFKHTEIFDRALAAGSPDQVRLAEAMRERCVAAGKGFVKYVALWSCNDVTGDWNAYRIATRTMIGAVQRHLANERIEAARLLGLTPAESRPRDVAPMRRQG